MTTPEYTAVRVPRAIHDRLLALQKTLSAHAQQGAVAQVTVSLGSVLEAALDAFDATFRSLSKGLAPPMKEIVYFILNTSVAEVKIGTSAAIGTRFNAFLTANPHLQIIATVPGGRTRETAIHAELKHLRVHGEWFSWTDELRQYVADLVVGTKVVARRRAAAEAAVAGCFMDRVAIRGRQFMEIEKRIDGLNLDDIQESIEMKASAISDFIDDVGLEHLGPPAMFPSNMSYSYETHRISQEICFAARWAVCGMPSVTLDRESAKAMIANQPSSPGEMVLPWTCFMINVPAGLVQMPEFVGRFRCVKHILVVCPPNNQEDWWGDSGGVFVVCSDEHMSVHSGETDPSLMADLESEDIERLLLGVCQNLAGRPTVVKHAENPPETKRGIMGIPYGTRFIIAKPRERSVYEECPRDAGGALLCDHSTFHYCQHGTHCDRHCSCSCSICSAERKELQ